MLTKMDVMQIIKLVKVNFDNSYRLSNEDMAMLVESWYEILSPYPRDLVMAAASNVIINAEATPRIGHIVKEAKKLMASRSKTEYDLWQELAEKLDDVADLARKFAYTFREHNGKTQGENAKDAVIEIFNGLDPAIRAFCVNPSGLIALAKEDEDQRLFERSRFLKSAMDLRERVAIQDGFRAKQIGVNVANIAALLGGDEK